jgi:lysozyme
MALRIQNTAASSPLGGAGRVGVGAVGSGGGAVNFNPSVRGPDVSFHQDAPTTTQQIDFQKMKAAGASFVIIRAGQNTWVDPTFSYNLLEARKAGLPTGAYFFYDSRVSPESQADLFLSLTKGITLELGIWLDIEEHYNGTYKGWQNWKKCLMRLKANAPFVGIYTAPSYWMTNRPTGSADLAYFKSFPLWIANYDVPAPIIPSPWEYAILWQMGTPAVGPEYGVESLEIDMNYWNGSPESFRAYFGIGASLPPAEPPTTEGNNMKGKVTKLTNVRASNTQFSTDMGDLLTGDLVEWVEEGTGSDGLIWIKLISATHNGAPVRCSDGGTVTGRYCWANNVEEILPVTPPVVEPPAVVSPVEVTVKMSDGSLWKATSFTKVG